MISDERLSARVADVQEFCNVLINSGYVLVKVPEDCSDDIYEGFEEESERVPMTKCENPFKYLTEDEVKRIERLIKEDDRRQEGLRLAKQAEHKNSGLLRDLMAWRDERAVAENVPKYFVATNKMLYQIVLQAPATMDELKSIKGFGPKLATRYGQDILNLVSFNMEEPG